MTVPSAELAATIAGADDIVVVRLDGGKVDLAPPGTPDAFGFSRTYLLDSVRATRAEHLALALDERLALSLSPADRPDDVHLVMPIRLHRQGGSDSR